MKAHLISSDVPLIEAQSLLALCKTEVPNARFVFMWDEQEMGAAPYYRSGICKKCIDLQICANFARYIYGIATFREVRTQEEG